MNKRIFIIAAMLIAATSILITGCFNKKATGIKVTPSAIMIPVNNNNNSLSADIEPIEAMTSTSITWTISDPNIATIDKLSDDWVLIKPKNVGEKVDKSNNIYLYSTLNNLV